MNAKVAFVYDRVNKWGGAERVLLSLKKLFPNAPLYTSVYSWDRARWAKNFEIKTSFLQKIPFATNNHEALASFMPIAFESFNFDEYDIVISVTSESAKGIITKPKTLHICYCLTPTRYLWSGYNEYFKNESLRFLASPIVSCLKSWDIAASSRPDKFIAISKEVKKRIKKYYNRDSVVVYPGVELLNKTSIENNESYKKAQYFLVVSRLVDLKKIDIVIKACNRLKLPLKIVGSGANMRYLSQIAGSTVEFLGNLTDEVLIQYYKECLALVCPSEEDFGLSVIEAQGFGKPVIAYGRGGALETVVDGKTGLFFKEQKIESLTKAIQNFLQKKIEARECIKNAEKFNQSRFEKEFMKAVMY